MATIKVGDMVLVTLMEWVIGPDGHNYKAICARMGPTSGGTMQIFRPIVGLKSEDIEMLEISKSMIFCAIKLRHKDKLPKKIEGTDENGIPKNHILFL